MSRKAIGVLYMLGISFELLGVWNFFVSAEGPFARVIAVVLLVTASILGIIAWIGMLVNLASAQSWTMFVLAFFFSGIIILIYLLSNAQTFAPKTVPQPLYGVPPGNIPYPSAGDAVSYPPAQEITRSPEDVIFKYGVIAGGVLQIVTILWYCINSLFPFSRYYLMHLRESAKIEAIVLFVGVPILLSLPVFFGLSRAAARRVGLNKAGLRVALHAWGWLMISLGLIFLTDFLLLKFQHFYSSPFLSVYERRNDYTLLLIDALLALFYLGAAVALGTLGGNVGARQSAVARQAKPLR